MPSGESASRRVAKDEVLVAALADGRSYAEAGELAGLSAKTAQRRMGEAEFARRVSRRRAERVSEITGLLVARASEAIAVIERECRDADRSADRLRAASLLLSMALRYRHSGELEERLCEIEAHIGLAEEHR